MPIPSFTVSQVRVAATCPRITYLDAEHTKRQGLKSPRVTRIWKEGDGEVACGTLFHRAIESFNARASTAREVREALEGSGGPREIERKLRAYLNLNCIDLDALRLKPPGQQQAFVRAVGIYMGELADIVGDALERGKPAAEVLDHLFGDRRRRVDVTFDVGPGGEGVRVTGIVDYVFHDWRNARNRIIDYKLTPASAPTNDLFQVSLYALMHNVQHRTQADAGVLYLHPERKMVEMRWEDVHNQRAKLYDLLASMASWVAYDESSGRGLKPPANPRPALSAPGTGRANASPDSARNTRGTGSGTGPTPPGRPVAPSLTPARSPSPASPRSPGPNPGPRSKASQDRVRPRPQTCSGSVRRTGASRSSCRSPPSRHTSRLWERPGAARRGWRR